MPSIKYIFQGLSETDDHLSAIEHLTKLNNLDKIIISVAFVRKSGLTLIDNFITPHTGKIEFFIGIRNGVTSIQAILYLLGKKIKPTVIDTASPSVIFHPKVFLSFSKIEALLLIGSANLTSGGLTQNIEASTLLGLDLSYQKDKTYFDQVVDTIYELRSKFPDNVFQIKDTRQAYELYKDGRLIDERVSTNFKVNGKRRKDKVGDISKISLNTRRLKLKPRKIKKQIATHKILSATHYRSEWQLLWESNPLTERDLNIPSGSNTNPTGSMLLKKGNMQNIDHRHFFREVIFSNLDWQNDTQKNKKHLQRTRSNFELIIKGISYDVFNLKLSHNTRTDTRSYEQRNAMTQIHWGEARRYIARRDLLNCILCIYKPIKTEDIYIIEIS